MQRHSSGSGGYGAALAADGPLRIPSVPGGAPPRGLAGGVQHVEFNFATTSGDSGRPPASLGGCHSRNGGLQGCGRPFYFAQDAAISALRVQHVWSAL